MIDEDLEYLRRTLNVRRNIWNGVCQLGMATFRSSSRPARYSDSAMPTWHGSIRLYDLDWRSYLVMDVMAKS